MEEDKRENATTYKLLLLGSRNSGQSRVFTALTRDYLVRDRITFKDKIITRYNTVYVPIYVLFTLILLKDIGIIVDMIHEKTSAINSALFQAADHRFGILNVNTRMGTFDKWTHCFEHATGIIFVASLCDYNKKSWFQDHSQNALIASTTNLKKCAIAIGFRKRL